MSALDVEMIKARAEAATGGRWHVVLGSGQNLCTGIAAEFDDGGRIFVADCLPIYAADDGGPEDHRPTMEFLRAARTDVPALCDEIARLRAALTQIAEGAGPFNRDPLTHAQNVITAAIDCANAALRGESADGDDDAAH